MRPTHQHRAPTGFFHGSSLLALPLLWAIPACTGEQPAGSDSATTSAAATDAPATTSSATATTSSTTATTAAPVPTTAADTSTGTSTGANFIPNPGGCLQSSAGPALRCSSKCDVYQQDCSPGEKCSPYSGDGDDAWDSVKCVPVARDPGAPGEPCTVEGSPVSGIDSCDVGALCWHVDPDTLTGTCVAMCAGSPGAPVCGPGLACHVDFDGVLNLCLPTCDPLLQDCEPGQLCIPSGAAFACLPAGAPDAPLFAPCEDLTTCAPGLHCAAPQLAPACDLMAPGCCLPYCDTAMPTCPPALQCLPWYEPGQAPAGLEDLGLCGIAP